MQVLIEYGLCEALCVKAIKPEYAPKDGIWFPYLSYLEVELPIRTIDHSVNMVYTWNTRVYITITSQELCC